jgi:tetratricopeptide (TPR) repeat protein
MIILLIGFVSAIPLLGQTPERKTETATALEQPTRSEAQILEERGDLMMVRKNFASAVDTFAAAIRITPGNAVLWNKMGIAHQQLLDNSHARKDYEKAIKLDRRYWQAMNNLGTVYYSERKYKRAIRLYQQALEIAPMWGIGYSNLGTALVASKKYPEAVAAYQKALLLDPDVFEHKEAYAAILQERNGQDRAMFYYRLARFFATANRQDKATEYLQKAMEEDFLDTRKIYQDPAFAEVVKTDAFLQMIQSFPAAK